MLVSLSRFDVFVYSLFISGIYHFIFHSFHYITLLLVSFWIHPVLGADARNISWNNNSNYSYLSWSLTNIIILSHITWFINWCVICYVLGADARGAADHPTEEHGVQSLALLGMLICICWLLCLLFTTLVISYLLCFVYICSLSSFIYSSMFMSCVYCFLLTYLCYFWLCVCCGCLSLLFSFCICFVFLALLGRPESPQRS